MERDRAQEAPAGLWDEAIGDLGIHGRVVEVEAHWRGLQGIGDERVDADAGTWSNNALRHFQFVANCPRGGNPTADLPPGQTDATGQ